MHAKCPTALLGRRAAPSPARWSSMPPFPCALRPIHKVQSNCDTPGHREKEETGNADVPAAVAAQLVTRERGQGVGRTGPLSAAQLLSRCSSRPHDSPRATAGPQPAPQPGCTARSTCHAFLSQLRYRQILSAQKNWSFSFQVFFFPSNVASLVLNLKNAKMSFCFILADS